MPAQGGRFHPIERGSALVGVLPRDAGDVATREADVSQFAVAEPGKLSHASIVASPCPQGIQDCNEHFLYLSGIKKLCTAYITLIVHCNRP
jgi:hypothetical protein